MSFSADIHLFKTILKPKYVSIRFTQKLIRMNAQQCTVHIFFICWQLG